MKGLLFYLIKNPDSSNDHFMSHDVLGFSLSWSITSIGSNVIYNVSLLLLFQFNVLQ